MTITECCNGNCNQGRECPHRTNGTTCKPHDPDHPYVAGMVGCGHGVLFTDECRDCEIVWAQFQYRAAVRAALKETK